MQEFQLRAQEKGVELSADLSERLPFVNADIRLIERVLENLIENALRYTPRGGAIEITLRQEEGRVKVEIHDSGGGIPAEELPHIFEGFHRVPGPNEGDIGVGSGLGLAISKHILELHQSMIEATSQLNQGTTFTFPRAGEAPELWRYEGGEGVTALLIVTRKSARLGS